MMLLVLLLLRVVVVIGAGGLRPLLQQLRLLPCLTIHADVPLLLLVGPLALVHCTNTLLLLGGGTGASRPVEGLDR
jgi:hypothetical protein